MQGILLLPLVRSMDAASGRSWASLVFPQRAGAAARGFWMNRMPSGPIVDQSALRRYFRGNVSDTDLRLLRVFRIVAERGGLSSAGMALNKSKSAVSLDISNLEERLGAVLCVRGRGGFALTEEGQIVYLAALQLFHDLEKFRDRVSTGLQRLTGKVSLLVIDNIVSVASAPLVRALSTFGKRHPGVEIRIDSANSVMVERGILEEEADIGISVVPRPVTTLSMIPLFREELRLYCGRGHPLFAVDKAELNQDLVMRHPLIEPSVTDDGNFASLLDRFNTAGQANSLDSRVMLVLSGLYLGFLPPHYADQWVAREELRVLEIDGLTTINTFFALIKKSVRQTAAAQRLLQTILAEFKASPVGLPLEAEG